MVEDEAAQRQLLFDYLTRHGYRVTGFQSGVGLRRLVEREMPALVRFLYEQAMGQLDPNRAGELGALGGLGAPSAPDAPEAPKVSGGPAPGG